MKNNDLRITHLKNELIKISQYFYSRGWMVGSAGNLSILTSSYEPHQIPAKTNFEFLITSSGKDKNELTEDDFLLVDNEGKLIQKAYQRPSAETLLHSAIYKHTETKIICHVHTTNVTLLSNITSNSYLTFSGLEMLKGLGFKTHDVTVNIPVIDNSQDMNYLANLVPGYIDEKVPGIILRGHGIYAWGKTPSEAKRHIEIFEFLFEYKIKELSLQPILQAGSS